MDVDDGNDWCDEWLLDEVDGCVGFWGWVTGVRRWMMK